MEEAIERMKNDKMAWEAVIIAIQGAIACFEVNLAPIQSDVATNVKENVVASLTKSLQSAQDALAFTKMLLNLGGTIQKLAGEEEAE